MLNGFACLTDNVAASLRHIFLKFHDFFYIKYTKAAILQHIMRLSGYTSPVPHCSERVSVVVFRLATVLVAGTKGMIMG